MFVAVGVYSGGEVGVSSIVLVGGGFVEVEVGGGFVAVRVEVGMLVAVGVGVNGGGGVGVGARESKIKSMIIGGNIRMITPAS